MAYAKTEEGRNKARIYQARWYTKNKARYLDINRKSRKKYLNEVREWIRKLKSSTPCSDCTKNYDYWIMDFDHTRGKKIRDVCHMVHAGISKKRILLEIEKCDIVCSNCHRERTHRRSRNSEE